MALPGASALLGLLYFILGYLFFATLMAGLGAVTTTAREGQQISGIFVVPAIVPFYLWPLVVSNPEGWVSRLLSHIPLTAPITVMVRLAVASIPPWEVALSSLILLGSVMVAMWLTAKLFRTYLLMYGKRPGLVEIWRALRRA